jgi:hypothetical protein
LIDKVARGHDRRFADGAEVRRAEPVGCSHIRLLPTNPPGDWTGVHHLSMERPMAAKKKKAAKKGGKKKK